MILIKRLPVRQCRVLTTRLCSRSFNTEQPLVVSELSAPAVSEAITHATALTSIPDHSFYNIVTVYQSLLDTIQVSTDLPWWGVLFATGVLTRIALFPVNISMEKKQLRDMPHTLHTTKLDAEIRTANVKGDQILALTKVNEKKFYKKKHNVRSIFWYFIPTTCVMGLNFMSIRGLTELPYQPLLDAPLLWLPNLCVLDPYYILPALNATMLMYVMKKGIDTGTPGPGLGDILKSPFGIGAFIMVFAGIQSFFPAALLVYWCASNFAGMTVIGPLMRNNEFRSKAGMVSMDEKNEVMAQMTALTQSSIQSATDLAKQARETSSVRRKTGHAKDKAANVKEEEKVIESEEIVTLKKELEAIHKELNEANSALQRKKEETEKQLSGYR